MDKDEFREKEREFQLRKYSAEAEEAELRSKREKALMAKELKEEDAFDKLAGMGAKAGKALLGGTREVFKWAAESGRRGRRVSLEEQQNLHSLGYGGQELRDLTNPTRRRQ